MLFAKSLNILCFGDSLTAGYSSSRGYDHPYGIALKLSLENALPSMNISVDVQGQGGDQVISPPGQFLPRMDKLFEEVHPKMPYDFAVILGGTNDLSQSREAEPIFQAIQKVWGVPLDHGTKVLSLTVPETGDAPPTTVKWRDMLNSLILSHQAQNFYTFDLHAAVPYFAMPENERKEIWDDTVHFTTKGYDLVGKLVGDQILELLADNAVDSMSKKNDKQELRRRG